MKHFSIVILIYLVCLSSCKEQKENTTDKTVADTLATSNTGIICDKWLSYEKKYNDSIWVKSSYNTCEPDWKTDLEFYINNTLIYTTESLKEYQFNEYNFPVIITNDSALFILIERDDRPLINKIDVFKIKNNKIDTIFSIPLFEQKGKDLDQDGVIEYAGYLEST